MSELSFTVGGIDKWYQGWNEPLLKLLSQFYDEVTLKSWVYDDPGKFVTVTYVFKQRTPDKPIHPLPDKISGWLTRSFAGFRNCDYSYWRFRVES